MNGENDPSKQVILGQAKVWTGSNPSISSTGVEPSPQNCEGADLSQYAIRRITQSSSKLFAKSRVFRAHIHNRGCCPSPLSWHTVLSRCTLMMGGVAPSDPPLFLFKSAVGVG
jgi:hypothetical protein